MMTRTEDVAEAVFGLLPPIFRECADLDVNWRYDLRFPRPVGEHIYATDGRIAVRVRATSEALAVIPPLEADKQFPKVDEMFAGEWQPAAVPFPDLSAAPPCEACNGKGALPERQCPECWGSGTTTCPECEHERECPECGGRRKFPAGPCPECGGCGIEDGSREGLDVGGGARLSFRFLALLRRHGAMMFLPIHRTGKHGRNPVRFVAPDGVEGLVMPLVDDWTGEG